MSRRLLLISSSRVHGSGYLEHVGEEIRAFLGSVERVLFVPYALHDRDGYARMTAARFGELGPGLESIHRAGDPRRAVERAEALFVGGGNTFRLLKTLYDEALLPVIRERVAAGMPYLGSSAGTNMASPTIKTTNDMPIVFPPSFEALGLVPFQINPHYLDPDPRSTHMGETREARIREFLEEEDVPVAGIREGGHLRIEEGAVTLGGRAGLRLFRRGREPEEFEPGRRLDFLLVP